MKMKRPYYVLFLLLTAFLVACGGGETVEEAEGGGAEADTSAATEGGGETVENASEPASNDDMVEGLLDGMTAEELQDAGYVVVAPGDAIRIGASVALTGPIPDPGRDIANGAELAIDDLNAAGGLDGVMFELDIQDGACDGDQGTVVANLFASDPSITAVSGGTCTGETFGLIPILQEARIPFVSPSATNPNVISPDCDICNRVALNDALQGEVDATYAYNELGLRTMAVMHDNSDYGLGLATVFQEIFENLGGTVVAFEGVQVGDTDFRPVLLEISTSSPEGIFFGGYSTEAGLITQQMEEVGLVDATFFSDDGAFTQQYLEAGGPAAEGAFVSFVAGDDVAELNAVFDAAYEEKYGSTPDDLGPFHGQSYDSVQLIADAIGRVAVSDEADEGYLLINREDLITAIRATEGLQGLTGVLTCDANGECGAGGIQIYEVQNGEFVQVSGFGLGDDMGDADVDSGEEDAAAEGIVAADQVEALQEDGYVVVAPGENIRIGASVALTGPIPDPGRDIANGAELAIDDLNAEGGLEGFSFELDVQDGACDGDQGTVVGNLFASDPSITAVSGGTCTGETFGLIPILQDARIPFVSPSATNPDVISEDCDVCNRVALNDALQGEVDANYVYDELGLTNVAVMHDNSDYGLGLATVFQEIFENRGGTVVAFEGVQVGDTDFRPVLLEISTSSPEAIFFGGYATEAGLIVQQMQEVGLGDAVFFSDDGAFTQQFLDAAGAAGEGAYASFVAGDEVAELNDAFDAAYLEKYGASPDDLGPFHAQSYDSVRVIADAIGRVAMMSDDGYLLINREELITAIRATEGVQGLTGLLTCDANGECGAGGIQIYQVTDGEFEQISGFGLDE